MEQLKSKILKDGRSLEGGVLKVDSFINHQLDASLMMDIAKEFVDKFSDKVITKVITIEASGIAPAIFVGYLLNVPVVFIKKSKPKTLSKSETLTASVYSFTKDRYYDMNMNSEYLNSDDKVLFIDDFLANGNAALGVLDLIKQRSAEIVGMGFIIEKSFQKGAERLKSEGMNIVSLARIASLDNCQITFVD